MSKKRCIVESPISVTDIDIPATYYKIGDCLGCEDIDLEFKLFTFGSDLIKYLKHNKIELEERYFITRTLDDEFNNIIIKSLEFYFDKYLCKYITSSSKTIHTSKYCNLYFGVDDNGIIKGIPYFGIIDTNIIISLIKKQFVNLRCEILEEYLKLIEVTVKQVECSVKPFDVTKKYMTHYEKKSEHDIKVLKYKHDFLIWSREYDFYNCGLNEICSNKSKRFHLYLFCQENGASQEILDYIASDIVILNPVGVRERKADKNSFDYWITEFKDVNVARVSKMKPKKISKKTMQHPFTYLYSNLDKMNGVWSNANYYLINIKIPFNLIPHFFIEFYNGTKWISSKRTISCRGDPECIECSD